MFSLREITRIRLCRAAFCALCLAPLGVILAWSGYIRLPAYRRAHEQAISAELGLSARLEGITSPRPGNLLYHGLELSDPELDQPLARLPYVEVRQRGAGFEIRLPYPAIVDGQRLESWWKLAHDRTREAKAERTVRITAQNLTLRAADGDHSFTDVAAVFEAAPEQSKFKLSFRRAASGTRRSDVAELSVLRTRQSGKVSEVLQLVTGNTPLPCSLAAGYWPSVAQLGKRCKFQGRVFAPRQGDQWNTQISGELREIDLDLLVSEQFPPHKLTGTANASVDFITDSSGRILSAGGRATAGPGVVSVSLMRSAGTHLSLPAVETKASNSDHLIPYKNLGLAFAIDTRGLRIRGELPDAPGALLVDSRERPLIAEPQVSSQAVLNLARVLVPHNEMQVPLARETAGLARVLPVPSIQPPGEKERPLEAKRIRIKPATPTKSLLK